MNLQNMAPNAKRSLLLTVVFGVVAAAIYLFAIEPTEARLSKATSNRDDAEQRHRIMMTNLKGAAKTEERLQNCESNLAPFRAAMLTPSLESYAMGAKIVLDPLALGAGLTEIEYEDLPPIALPVPKRLPGQLHARLPVRLSAAGSYQAAISFLLRLEREFPLISLEALDISTSNDNNRQHVEIILEWPVLGAVTVKPKGVK